MPRFRAPLLIAAGLALALSGCASPDPKLFTLSQVSGPVQTKAPTRIEVRSVSIARYLDRPQVVRSTSNNQVVIGGNERWGDPLGSMVSRIVAENLGQRLPKAVVFNGDSALSVTPNALVEIDIQRMDLDHSGVVVLAAQVAVSRGNGTPTVKTVRYEVRPASTDTKDLVRAMSTALGQLSDAIVQMLG